MSSNKGTPLAADSTQNPRLFDMLLRRTSEANCTCEALCCLAAAVRLSW